MKDLECIEFLQWCLPRLRLRWSGFRKVRRQVCKRLNRRIRELGIPDIFSYKGYLDCHSEEWKSLDSLCRITISRFYRDRGVFDTLRSRILPALAKGALESNADKVRCWCAGCGSGEEAYTLQILWKLCIIPVIQEHLPLLIVATDINPVVLERAVKGVYTKSSLSDLPGMLVRQAFTCSGGICAVKKGAYGEDIEFVEQDIREQLPEGTFQLVLCRNLVFTYFDESLQLELFGRIWERLEPGGFLVTGIHESLPEGVEGIIRHNKIPGVYQKATF